MPLHRNADGTTVNIAWPPPKESSIKIHTRIVKTVPEKAKPGDGEKLDKESGWALKATEFGAKQQEALRKLEEPPSIMEEADFASMGPFGWFQSLLLQGSSMEKFDDEGWMNDGPMWIRNLSNDHKRYLIKQVVESCPKLDLASAPSHS